MNSIRTCSVLIVYLITTFIYCDTFSQDDWSYENIDEGPCYSPIPKPATFNTVWLVSALKSHWYVPMSAKLFIYLRARLQNHSITEEYLASMCLKFTPSTPLTRIMGLSPNDTVIVGCKSESIGQQRCLVQREDDIQEIGGYLSQVHGISAWTDNTDFILLIICTTESNEGNKMWILLSNKKTISDEEQIFLLKKVEEFGFNSTLATNFVENETQDCTEPF